MKSYFTADEYGHYQFTPQHLTLWTQGLVRYNIDKEGGPTQLLLLAWVNEACHIFRDRLVGNDARAKFDNLLSTILRSDWGTEMPDVTRCYITSATCINVIYCWMRCDMHFESVIFQSCFTQASVCMAPRKLGRATHMVSH